MSKLLVSLFAAMTLSLPATAAEFATAKDAEAMVGKLVKAVAANKDAAIKEVNAKDAKWTHGDLYAFALTTDGTVVAHPVNEKLIGKTLIDLQDVDGKSFVKEYIEATVAKGKSWTDYKYTDPVTKKVLPKSAYCEKAADLVVCAGIYKR